MRIIKKRSVPTPLNLESTEKQAVIIFTDKGDGKVALELVFGPDDLADPTSLAHKCGVKAYREVKAILDKEELRQQVIEEQAEQTWLDEICNTLGQPGVTQ